MEYPFKDLLPLDEVLEREGYYKDWTHLDPKVFYSLTQISEYIKTKGYGVDVRLLIAQLAEHFGLKTAQMNEIERLFNDVMKELSEDKDYHSLPEIAGARGGFDTLGARLDDTTVQLTQKVGGGKKANLEDLDETVLNAIEGGEGTSFNLLSIPQDNSTTFEKLGADLKQTFNKNQINLYDPSLAVDGKTVNYANGLISDSPTSAILGKQPVEAGKTYTLSMPSQENGFDYHFRCYDEQGVFIGNSGVYASAPVASGIQASPDSVSGDRKVKVFTLTADSLVRFVDIQIIFPYTEHTTDDFNRIRNSIQLEENAYFTRFEPYGTYTPTVSEQAMPTSYESIKSAMAKFVGKRSNFVIVKKGTQIAVRTKFSDTQDFINLWEYPKENTNRGLNLVNWYVVDESAPDDTITGTVFKNSGDDVTPLFLQDSYVGANHGYSELIRLTATAHGKTVDDTGSLWAIGGKQFILYDVIDANTLRVFSNFTGVQTAPVNKWTSNSGTLIHVSGAVNSSDITFTAYAKDQLHPMTNNKYIKLLLDDKDLIADGVYYGDKFDLVEVYNIMDVPSIQTYLKTLVGTSKVPNLVSNTFDGWVNVTNVFSHGRNGSVTVKTGYNYLKDTAIGYYGVVQAINIGVKAYVPDVGIVDGKDMSTVVTQGANALSFTSDTWLKADKPPYRYHQFSDDMLKGVALGYNPQFGIAKPSIRVATGTGGVFNGSTKKLYPYVQGGKSAISGDYEETIAFRVPLRVIDADATCLYWYWIGNDVYLAFDYHKNIDKFIELPSYLTGKKIEQLDVHANVTIQSEFVSAKGIKVKVANSYGFGVLKLYD